MSTTHHSPVEALAVWEGQVASGLTAAIDMACPAQPRLRAALTHLVRTRTDGSGRSPRRVFALAVLGAITGRPEAALPVCVVSHLWWAGAEALDDLMDAGGDPASVDGADTSGPGALSGAGLLTAGIACMTVVPQAYLALSPLPERLRLTWLAGTATSSLAAAEGQLADMAREPSALRWPHVMATYVGKTGAAYERDAVMAAQLATDDETTLRGWRTFGQLFGVLRQTRNDNSGGEPADDEDLANGTPTLLVAHALDVLPAAERAEILALRSAAMSDPAARIKMRAALCRPDIVAGYRDKLRALRRHARDLLDGLAGPSDFRDVLRSWIDSSYVSALPGGPEHVR